MNTKRNFLSRRKWLKVSGMASVGGLFSGMVIQPQINSNDSNGPKRYKTKQPSKKSSKVSLVKGEDHYQIVFQSLKNIEN